jgi:hypothetical protein
VYVDWWVLLVGMFGFRCCSSFSGCGGCLLLCLHVLSVIVLAVMEEYSWVCYCFDDYIVVFMFGLLFSFIPQHHVILALAGLLFCLDFLAAFSLGCWEVCLLLSGDPPIYGTLFVFCLIDFIRNCFLCLATEIATMSFFFVYNIIILFNVKFKQFFLL